jgi:hypothetical protein
MWRLVGIGCWTTVKALGFFWVVLFFVMSAGGLVREVSLQSTGIVRTNAEIGVDQNRDAYAALWLAMIPALFCGALVVGKEWWDEWDFHRRRTPVTRIRPRQR